MAALGEPAADEIELVTLKSSSRVCIVGATGPAGGVMVPAFAHTTIPIETARTTGRANLNRVCYID